MEDLWSNMFEQLSDACRALRLDPNYSPSSYRSFSDDDDDPLGRPEITVKINDDWTISSDENSRTANEPEDSDGDETEIRAPDSTVLESFLNNVSSLSGQDLTSDEEDQTVPSSAKRICRIMLSEKLTSAVREVDEEDAEESDYQDEEEEEKEDVFDKEIANRSDDEEATKD